jgi:Zn finger protein HypA/HybF involved in hydrogenase expression
VHEHGLGDLLLTGLHDHLAALPPGRGLRVRVRVSEIAGLTQDALQQALDHVCEHHGAPPIALELISDGLLGRCPTCASAVPLNDDLACSVCGDTHATICAGETLLIEEVTVCPAEECTGG